MKLHGVRSLLDRTGRTHAVACLLCGRVTEFFSHYIAHRFESAHDVGMSGGDVVLFADVGRKIVQRQLSLFEEFV